MANQHAEVYNVTKKNNTCYLRQPKMALYAIHLKFFYAARGLSASLMRSI
jgi:hypothetical protein